MRGDAEKLERHGSRLTSNADRASIRYAYLDLPMDTELFESLLSKPESSTLDFKATGYNFSDSEQQLCFAKDILCMANSPRPGDAYIILGIKRKPDGTNDLWGIADHSDDALMQSHVADRLSPAPSFTYEPFTYKDQSFGVIRIPLDKSGPFMAFGTKLGEKLHPQKIYFRRNSKNDIATTACEISRICSWMQNVPGINKENFAIWDDFMEAANYFDKSSRFILVAPPAQMQARYLSSLGKIPWSMVFDFDEFSDTQGLLATVRSDLELRRSLHQVALGDRLPLAVDRATYWFYARGIEGREKTLQTGSWLEWAKVYRREIAVQLEALATAINPAPIVALVLWPDSACLNHLRTTLESLVATLGDYVQVLIVSEMPGELSAIATDIDAKILDIPLEQLAAGISLQFMDPANDEGSCVLPGSTGAPIPVDPKDFLWLEEELQVVHSNIGLHPDEERETGLDFLRGGEISWFELANHWDIDRDLEPKVARKLDEALQNRRSLRINLYHAPGAGGTTLGRRLAWRFHELFPTAILSRCEPAVTVERLHLLSSLTGGRPILLIIDSSQIEERQIDDLFTFIRARQVPVVLLQVLRRFSPQQERERTFYLPNELSNREAHLLTNKLVSVKPERRSAIEKVRDSVGENGRNPFYFGLHAFEKEFTGLRPYLSHRLAATTEIQRRILTYIALSHHYAQQQIRAQAFAELLGLPQNKSVKLEKYLPDPVRDVLVAPKEESWRTAHELIAREIIEQVLSWGQSDSRIWRQNLSTWSRMFAEFCRGTDLIPSSDMLEIVRRTFIYRDNADVLGTERSGSQSFAQILDDIPLDEGKLEVMKVLVELYPDEPHFWSHLGRMYSLRMGNFAEAINCAEKAIALSPTDAVLYHMHGMILRRQIYDYIEQRRPVEELVPIAKDASASFEKSREFNSDDDHGYISEVQMLIRVLDYAGRDNPKGVLGYLAQPNADVFLRESIQHAEDLLEQIRRHREGEDPSTYEGQSRGDLNKLYGKHDEALQIWDSLLSRGDAYRPPLRRQIVRTYLARRDRSWKQLEKRELSRVVDLLTDNIAEDPTNEKDLRLWVQAIRYMDSPPSLESIIERLSYWRANSGSLDAIYYLYVFHGLLAMDGFSVSLAQSQQFLDESRKLAHQRRNRTKSFEWLGEGSGLKQLVHQSELGDWDRNTDFWEGTSRLVRIGGRIEKIEGSQAGWISVPGGLRAFFVPSRSGHTANRSENALVDFYLGFSYDGPRSWEVRDVVQESVSQT